MTKQYAFAGNPIKGRRLDPARAIGPSMSPPIVRNREQNIGTLGFGRLLCPTDSRHYHPKPKSPTSDPNDRGTTLHVVSRFSATTDKTESCHIHLGKWLAARNFAFHQRTNGQLGKGIVKYGDSPVESSSTVRPTFLFKPDMTSTICEDKVREQLKQVIDPEMFVNIVDLGLIYNVNLETNAEDEAKTDIKVDMSLTIPCAQPGHNWSRKAVKCSRAGRFRHR